MLLENEIENKAPVAGTTTHENLPSFEKATPKTIVRGCFVERGDAVLPAVELREHAQDVKDVPKCS